MDETQTPRRHPDPGELGFTITRAQIVSHGGNLSPRWWHEHLTAVAGGADCPACRRMTEVVEGRA